MIDLVALFTSHGIDTVVALATGRVRVPLLSSAIADLDYALADVSDVIEAAGTATFGELTVNFTDGTAVSYPSISPDQVVRFALASSPGAFFNSVVRRKWG